VEFVDHYKILGISRDASQEEIKKAYKKLALEHHPDRNKSAGSPETFRKVVEAYKVLSDARKKQEYDLRFKTPPNPFDGFGFADAYESVFRGFNGFNNGFNVNFNFYNIAPTNYSERGEDVELKVLLQLEEAVLGCSKEVESFGGFATCETCSGSRAKPGSKIVSCINCSGSGKTRRHNRQGVKCPTCKGFGSRPLSPCNDCNGNGNIKTKKNVTVKIPPGVDTGSRLRLVGMGCPGINGENGDLFIEITVMPHHRFKRHGINLSTEFAVPLIKAIRGGIIEIPSLNDNTIKVSIPTPMIPGISTIVIGGAGVKDTHSNKIGDLCITLQVKLPSVVSAKALQLMDELEKEETSQK
jgi:molecular chaperone DnaJ